jgi:hypothetical protein
MNNELNIFHRSVTHPHTYSSYRPYRPALGIDKALEEIVQNNGTLYDADVVETSSTPNILSTFQLMSLKYHIYLLTFQGTLICCCYDVHREKKGFQRYSKTDQVISRCSRTRSAPVRENNPYQDNPV